MNEEQLIRYFTEVMEEIFSKVMSVEDMLNEESVTSLIESISEALSRLGLTVDQVIPGLIEDSYNLGIKEASEALKETAVTAGVGVTAEASLAAGAVALTVEEKMEVILAAVKKGPTKVQKRIHLEAIQEIANDSLSDLRAAINTSRQNAINSFKDIRGSMAKGVIKGEHNRVVTKKVQEDFIKHGLTAFKVTNKNGTERHLPLDFYARTVTRTKIRSAHTRGSLNRYTQAGVNLVKVFGNSVTCHVCAKYRDMVFCIDGKEEGFPAIDETDKNYQKLYRLPPFHPNCYCTLKPYVKDFKTEEEIQEEKERWKNFKPDEDTRTKKQIEAYEKEQKIRRETNEGKKIYNKMKRTFVELDGEKDFPSLSTFLRWRRTGNSKYKELMKRYREATRMPSAE